MEKIKHTEKKRPEKKDIRRKKNDDVNEPSTAWIYSNLHLRDQMFEEKNITVLQKQSTQVSTGSLKDNFIILL